ncbi:MAG: pilus assembly protein CpaE [Cellvibrionaceae bacterium]
MAHIFVVDDDEQLLRMVGLMLERGGHTATLASNSVEALDMIRENVPDLAILDVMMPSMNGLELCRALRKSQSTRNLPILILTARGPIEERDEALELGADSYLNKPVTSAELLDNVDNLLAKAVEAKQEAIEESVTAIEDGSTIEPEIKSSCKTIAIYGFAGGIGRTTIAVNLASWLQQNSKGKVCLVDFTTSGGQAAMHLRLQTRQGWANLVDNDEISSNNISDQIIEHSSGLHLLAAPLMPVEPEILSIETAERIFSQITADYAYVVFDLPSSLSPVVKVILRKAGIALHVFTPEVISVQTAVRVERLIQPEGPELNKRFLVLNQSKPHSQLARSTVERGLNATIDFYIQFDSAQSKAVVQGIPIAMNQTETAISEGVSEIAKKLLVIASV